MPKGDREIYKADCDDGFTKISNLLLEALAIARLNGIQKGICMFLFRRTYGWNRSNDTITLGEFAEACGTSKEYISRQLGQLINKNIICRLSYQPGKTPVYSFVTTVSDWDRSCIDLDILDRNAAYNIYGCSEKRGQGLHNTTTPDVQGLHESTIQGLYNCTIQGLHESAGVNQLSIFEPPAIEPVVKTEEKTIKNNKIFSSDTLPFQLSELLLNKILEHLPSFKKPDLQKWAGQMDAIMRLDHRPAEELKAVIIFAQGDSFWQRNILSVDKLRKQYDQLNAKRLQARASPAARQVQSSNLNGEKADEYDGFFN